MIVHVQDFLWSPLRRFVLSIPPSRSRYFPVITGSIWFLTLAALLLTWLGRGMPRYPGQTNPDVAFISDIASFELQPLFLVGATMTAAGYVVTICAVHVLHYESEASMDRRSMFDPAMDDIDDVDYGGNVSESEESADNPAGVDAEDEDEDTAATLRLISLVSIFAAAVAGSALILLAVMDNVRYHRAHAFLLRICFAGLVVQSTGSVVVYARDVLALMVYAYHPSQHRPRIGSRSFTVGLCATLSIVIILVEVSLGAVFIAFLAPEKERFREAGILEWIIAFVGTIYLWLFGGFLNRHSARIVLK